MKFTQYFHRNRTRPDRKAIRQEWIESVVRNPLRKAVQADGRVRLWGRVGQTPGRILRVILLEDEETVHNAFFDRRFKEEADES